MLANCLSTVMVILDIVYMHILYISIHAYGHTISYSSEHKTHMATNMQNNLGKGKNVIFFKTKLPTKRN